jgi:hypothetical protein
MKKENIYYLMSVLIGLICIPMMATNRYVMFAVCFSLSALLLLKAIFEDIDNIEF